MAGIRVPSRPSPLPVPEPDESYPERRPRRLRKWGYIATIVVSAINLLLSAPGIVGAPNTATKAISGVFTLVSAAIIVLVTRPEARRAYR